MPGHWDIFYERQTPRVFFLQQHHNLISLAPCDFVYITISYGVLDVGEDFSSLFMTLSHVFIVT